MKNLLLALFVAIGGLAFASQAEAATCFWITGTGNLNDTTHWASTSGGTASTCAAAGGFPNSVNDNATFDGNSGGGTVTDNVSAGWTANTVTMSAFTGTFDDSVNNYNVTIAGSFVNNGSAIRTLKCGTGTWTFTDNGTTGGVWNFQGATNLTETCTGATIKFQPGTAPVGPVTFLPYTSESTGNISLVWPTTASFPFYFDLSTGATINSLAITGSASVLITPLTTLTITTAPTLAGTQSHIIPFLVWRWDQTTQATITAPSSGASYSWLAFKSIVMTNAVTANNSYDFGNNSGLTINPPSGGGGGAAAIIGGF